MNHCERQLAAIRREPADRVSIDAIAVENTESVAALLQVEPDQVIERLELDGRIVSAAYTETREGLTEWGTPNVGHYGTLRPYPLDQAASLGDIERFSCPDIQKYDFETAAANARSLGREYALRGPYWKPLFCRVCDLFGMEEAMVKLHLEPHLFEGLLEQVFAHTAEYCKRLLEACGEHLPILCLGDDFATQRGMMIDPARWRRFLKPRYGALFELGKQQDKLVWFHSCGDITAILPDLIDLGMDVWETVQLHTLPLSPAALKREYGRDIAFFGGVNTQRLPFSTPEEVREEVRQCIEVLGRGGGYICGPDHHIKPDVPAANTVALFEAARGGG